MKKNNKWVKQVDEIVNIVSSIQLKDCITPTTSHRVCFLFISIASGSERL